MGDRNEYIQLHWNFNYFSGLLTFDMCSVFSARRNRMPYRVSQEERTKLREGVPYVKLYRYNPKHLCPKLKGFRDNGKWSLKLWQLLHTYWLPNSYWNWQEYVVSVMLISVLNIKVTCEWHKAINLNCKVSGTRVIIHRVRSTIHHTGMLSGDVTRLVWHMQGYAFQASSYR